MRQPEKRTKVKVTLGYSLLLTTLFFSLLFVHQQISRVAEIDHIQANQTDSLVNLLRSQNTNTLEILNTIQQLNKQQSTSDRISAFLAAKDSLEEKKIVQRRVITKTDSIITKQKPKNFFKRVAEVFSPSKKDSAILLNTSLEFSTDTIIENAEQLDSLKRNIEELKREQEQARLQIEKKRTRLQRINQRLNKQIDHFLETYKEDLTRVEHNNLTKQQEIRRSSVKTISWIALGATTLAILFLVLIWRDISKSKQYRRELEAANHRAQSLLLAREKLMLTITHDIKAPLSSILGFVDLANQQNTQHQLSTYLNNIKSSSNHLLQLVNSLLEFHRLDLNKTSLQPKAFNPTLIFQDLTATFKFFALKKGLNFESNIDPGLDNLFFSDPIKLQQICTNLLSNAIKFTEKGKVQFTFSYWDPSLTITVQDTGRGMTLDEQERIFKEFVRLSNAQGEEGFGLGLSIVHKLVHLFNGEINIDSEPNKGTTFSIKIPFSKANHQQIIATEKKPKVRQGDILLIDDDKLQLQLTEEILHQYGYEVTTCLTKEELLLALRKKHYQLLITDIQMPDLNGLQLINWLEKEARAEIEQIPVLAVTARDDISADTLIKKGFIGCLYKPFSTPELIEAIHTALSHSLANLQKKEEPLADHYTLNPLLDFAAGDPVAQKEILLTFLNESVETIEQLKKIDLKGDTASFYALLHKLTPRFKIIGLNHVADEMIQTKRKGLSSFNEESTALLEKLIVVLGKCVEEAKERVTNM